MATSLAELSSLEILVIVDNELDPISASPHPSVQQEGGLRTIAFTRGGLTPEQSQACGGASHQMAMHNICCGAHGLSLLITGTKASDGTKHTILFDAGPEGHVFERNVKRLAADLGEVELVHLSHWHRDHSGGMVKALEMIGEAKKGGEEVIVDLHPERPDLRGFQAPQMPAPVCLEADPTFEELERAGGKVVRSGEAHVVLDATFMISDEIPRETEYEKGIQIGMRFDEKRGSWHADPLIKDERFVMVNLKDKGLVVFTGCSHAGVVNVARHAKQLGGNAPLYSVFGGYHLADAEPEVISQTVGDLQALKPTTLIAGHCTGWRAKFEIEKQMPGALVPSFVGSRYVL